VEIDFETNGTTNGKMVAPFIFLPFVENAIKHGLSIENESFIKIQFDIEDDKINFSVKNSKPEQPTQKLGGGIGLNNVKRRLELLYPNKHDLQIIEEKNTFEIKLLLEN
jgi:Putative regulator of cell autolysis